MCNDVDIIIQSNEKEIIIMNKLWKYGIYCLYSTVVLVCVIRGLINSGTRRFFF